MTTSLQKRLAGYGARVKELNGLTSHFGQFDGLDAVFAAAQNQGEAEQKATAELLLKARRGDQAAMTELCELRMETVDLYVRATSTFAAMFFETVTLKDNEQFVVEHSYRNPAGVRYVGQDGGARTVKAVKARKQTFVDVRELQSNAIGYQMRDIQQGNDVAAAAQATVDVAWDMANKIDVEAFNLLQGGTINGLSYGNGVYGSFTTTGANLSRTYVANARINTSNLPTTNQITLSDNGTSTNQSNKFRLAVIRAIMKYCDSWANIWGGPIRPTGAILIPSSESTDLSAEIVPTGTFYNQVAEGLLQQYTKFSYMGVNWTLIPDVTLPPGLCYPVLNRPVGKILVKPSFDQEFVESNPRKNWEERVGMKVIAFTTFEPMRVNALTVQYSSAYSALSTNE